MGISTENQIELLRKLHTFEQTFVEWNKHIVSALREENLEKLHNLKLPEGLTNNHYKEMLKDLES